MSRLFLQSDLSRVLGFVDLAVEVVDVVALEFELAAPAHQEEKEEKEREVADPNSQTHTRIDLIDFEHGMKRTAQFDGEIDKRNGDRSDNAERSGGNTDLVTSAPVAAEDKVRCENQP